MIQTVVKRDCRIVGFNQEKIAAAIRNAMLHVGPTIGRKSTAAKVLSLFEGAGGFTIESDALQERIESSEAIVEYCLDDIEANAAGVGDVNSEKPTEDIRQSVSVIREELTFLKDTSAKMKEALTDVTQALLDVIGSTREAVHFSGDFIPINFRIEMYKAIGHRVYLIEDPGELANFALSMLSQEESASPYSDKAISC